jgi:uncharacterized protein
VTSRQKLKFRLLAGAYAIVRMAPDAFIPEWAVNGEFTSITRSAEELSIVCAAEDVPDGVNGAPRWVCLKLEGPFAFSQTGVLLSFIEPLSANGIPIFAISSYDTDYVLITEETWAAAQGALERAGHELIR